jgi:hypothetical protein
MRFKKMRLSRKEYPRPRVWKISRRELETMFSAYRLQLPKEIAENIDSALGEVGGVGLVGGVGGNPSNPSNPSNMESGQIAEILPKIPCNSCQSIAWYVGPGGNILCGRCHPDPRVSNDLQTALPFSQSIKGK